MKKFILFLLNLIIITSLLAQRDTLPKFSAVLKDGKIIISWANGFKNVSQINIQRSKDSLKNYSTIHSLSNPDVKTYSFEDKTAKNDSGYYRIFILFEGTNYIFTPSNRLMKVTGDTYVTLKTNESVLLQEKQKEEKIKEEKNQPAPKPVWVPSVYIYTGNDGNAVIKLPDASSKKYSVKFMGEDGSLLFLIPHITDTNLVLDKVNFLKSGWYFFELLDNGTVKEKNKLLITRDF